MCLKALFLNKKNHYSSKMNRIDNYDGRLWESEVQFQAPTLQNTMNMKICPKMKLKWPFKIHLRYRNMSVAQWVPKLLCIHIKDVLLPK